MTVRSLIVATLASLLVLSSLSSCDKTTAKPMPIPTPTVQLSIVEGKTAKTYSKEPNTKGVMQSSWTFEIEIPFQGAIDSITKELGVDNGWIVTQTPPGNGGRQTYMARKKTTQGGEYGVIIDRGKYGANNKFDFSTLNNWVTLDIIDSR